MLRAVQGCVRSRRSKQNNAFDRNSRGFDGNVCCTLNSHRNMPARINLPQLCSYCHCCFGQYLPVDTWSWPAYFEAGILSHLRREVDRTLPPEQKLLVSPPALPHRERQLQPSSDTRCKLGAWKLECPTTPMLSSRTWQAPVLSGTLRILQSSR